MLKKNVKRLSRGSGSSWDTSRHGYADHGRVTSQLGTKPLVNRHTECCDEHAKMLRTVLSKLMLLPSYTTCQVFHNSLL